MSIIIHLLFRLQRFAAHSQFQCTAVHYILMREEWSLQLIAVQHNALHILVIAAIVVGYHLERLAVFQMNGRLVEHCDVNTLFSAPRHPLSQRLLAAHLALYGLEKTP